MILLVPNELIRILEKKHHKGSFDTYKYANCPIIAAIEYFFLSHKKVSSFLHRCRNENMEKYFMKGENNLMRKFSTISSDVNGFKGKITWCKIFLLISNFMKVDSKFFHQVFVPPWIVMFTSYNSNNNIE